MSVHDATPIPSSLPRRRQRYLPPVRAWLLRIWRSARRQSPPRCAANPAYAFLLSPQSGLRGLDDVMGDGPHVFSLTVGMLDATASDWGRSAVGMGLVDARGAGMGIVKEQGGGCEDWSMAMWVIVGASIVRLPEPQDHTCSSCESRYDAVSNYGLRRELRSDGVHRILLQ